MPNGNVPFATEGENDVMVSVNCLRATFAPFVGSKTCARNVYVPSAVGVPLRMPSVDSATPGGSAPPMTAQLYDGRQHAVNC